MGKFFDALEKFGNETAVPEGSATSPVPGKGSCGEEPRGFLDGNISPNLIPLFRPDTFESEQFRVLRTNIMFPAFGKPPRVILVTSAVSGEGKSFVASNLAVTMAQSVDSHMLLLDCDLRIPSIHRVFGFPDSVSGLGNVLKGECELSSVFLSTKVEKLSIIPGVGGRDKPAELLSSDAMGQVLSELRNRYGDRYIVIDSPPPIITPETLALTKIVDSVILVIRNEKTARGLVKDVVDAIGRDKVSGVIANRYDVRLSRYNGNGVYGLYYGREKGK